MDLTRRALLQSIAAAAVFARQRGLGASFADAASVAAGPFEPSRASLAAWQVPDWFRNAKFGIWAHWGPQSSVEAGDWYARNMYMEGSPQYRHHVETYGHPSKVGFKDVIPKWKAERFDPPALMKLYRKAGARYFMSMGVHHDNFDLWNSAHTRWNAVAMGPRRDVVGEFAAAARGEGLRFAVSDHLWISYKWFSTSHGHDSTGALAGVPYDGVDKANADLYHDITDVHTKLEWNDDGITDAWKQTWFRRIKDLVDKYDPDLLYCDGPIPFGDIGLGLLAHLYNQRAAKRGGAADAVYTSKRREDSEQGTCVFDVERGVVDAIWPRPWQTDTCIGDWHYKRGITYKSAKTVVDLLADIVSRNGNLMLNFPLPNSGMLDDDELKVLSGITDWMAVNADAIHDTRPWKIFGDGPVATAPKAAASSSFNEKARKDLDASDVRFTTKGDALYAIVMGLPGRAAAIPALAPGGPNGVGTIRNVELLGAPGKLEWRQDASGLHVTMPATPPSDYAVAFKIAGA